MVGGIAVFLDANTNEQPGQYTVLRNFNIDSLQSNPAGEMASLEIRETDYHGTVIVELKTGDLVKRFPGEADNSAWTPDGRTFILSSYDGITKVFDTATWAEKAQLVCEGPISVSPDGRTLASFAHNEIRLWNLATYRELLRIPVPAYLQFINPRFTDDGRSIISKCYIWGWNAIAWSLPSVPSASTTDGNENSHSVSVRGTTFCIF